MWKDASPADVARAREIIRAEFQRTLDELLRGRPNPEPAAEDAAAIQGLAERAVRIYHAATSQNPDLPRLSEFQLSAIRQDLYLTSTGRGPLGHLLSLEGVEDIFIMGPHHGYLEYGDHQETLKDIFASEEEMTQAIRYYAEQAGEHIDPGKAHLSAVLWDGSRLNASLAPLAKPSLIAIRKHNMGRFKTLQDLVSAGVLPVTAVPVLEAAVRARLNIVISGPAGSGKTSLARVLALLIPPGERTMVLETETELWLHELRPEFASLEAREPNVEGAGETTLTELFQKVALRQRPKRVIVGEVRGPEAMDMLYAINSGHDGSFTTIHASGPRLALDRLESLALSSNANLSRATIVHMLGRGVDLIVQLTSETWNIREVRRLESMAFVDHNGENVDAGPLLSELCRLGPDGSWEWDPMAVSCIPDKIAYKFKRGGVDTSDLRRAAEGWE